MKKIILFFWITFWILLITSCSGQKGKSTPTIQSGSDSKLKIELFKYPGLPKLHKEGGTLAFGINNLSDEIIVFPNDFGIKIHVKKDSDWIPVENLDGYTEGDNLLPPRYVSPTGLSFFVTPKVSPVETTILVRISIKGYVKGKTAEKITGYIDVQYSP